MAQQDNSARKAMEKFLRQQRLGMNLVFGILAVVFLLAGVFLYGRMDEESYLVLVATSGGTLFILLVVLGLAVAPMKRALAEAISLTKEPGRPMRMAQSGMFDAKGLLVFLWEPDAPESARPDAMAVVRANVKNPRLGKDAHDVTVYTRLASPGRPVVIESEKHVFWGKLVNKQMAAEGWKWVRAIFLGMLLVGVISLGVVVWISSMTIDRAERDLELAYQSMSWSLADGVVTSSEVRETKISKGKGSVKGYKAVITYTYTVSGETYENDFIHFGYEPGRSPEPARALVERYPAGATAYVAYHPEHPEVSVLEAGHADAVQRELDEAYDMLWYMAGLSLIVVLLPVGLIVYYARVRRKVLDAI